MTADMLKCITHELISNIDIEGLDFSNRTYHSLKRSGVNTIGDILKLTYEDLLSLRSLGVKSAFEIQTKLKLYNLKLKEN